MRELASLISALLFILYPSTSFAEWIKFGEGDTDGNSRYIESKSIEKQNGYVYYWQLEDYLKRDRFGDLSNISREEVDCNFPKKVRTISVSFFSQKMGAGPISESFTKTSNWMTPSPGTKLIYLLDKLCKLKN